MRLDVGWFLILLLGICRIYRVCALNDFGCQINLILIFILVSFFSFFRMTTEFCAYCFPFCAISLFLFIFALYFEYTGFRLEWTVLSDGISVGCFSLSFFWLPRVVQWSISPRNIWEGLCKVRPKVTGVFHSSTSIICTLNFQANNTKFF